MAGPGIATTFAYPKHLDREIWKMWFNEYGRQRLTYDLLAKVGTAPKGSGGGYTEALTTPLGNLRTKLENDGIEFDTPVEGNKKTVKPTVYALGFRMSEEMAEDDKFGHFLSKYPKELGKSAAYKPEVEFWSMLNDAFDGTYFTGWDTKALCTTDHATLKSRTTIDNDLSAAALSETSLQAMFEYYDDLVDEAGRPLAMTPKYLVIPNELRFTAQKLMRNYGAIGTGNNDLNTMNPSHSIVGPYEIIMSSQLTDTNAYFLIAEEHDLRLWWLRRTRLRAWNDPYTGGRLYATDQRFFTFFMDYKGVVGNEGA